MLLESNQESFVDLSVKRNNGFSLSVKARIPSSGITVLFGPSGSGKTTVLRCIAGLERAEGIVQIAGSCWQDDSKGIFLPAWKRPQGYVFQESSLFPHLSARGNIYFAMKGSKDKQTLHRVEKAIDLLGISDLLDHMPAELSGGERQRVSITRALATDPKIMLFDEPLSALDYARKQEILPWLEKLKKELGIPMLYVTHSPEEVVGLADSLLILEEGKLKASGHIQDVLSDIDTPIRIGEDVSVLINAQIDDVDERWNLVTAANGDFRITIKSAVKELHKKIRLRIFAKDVSIAKKKPESVSIQNCLEAEVKEISECGTQGDVLVKLNCHGQKIISRITALSAHKLTLKEADKVWLLIKAAALAEL